MMSLLRRLPILIAICSVSFVALCGCGRGSTPLAPAKGVITLEGAPLVGGTVTFATVSGQVAMGTTNDQGEFTLKTGDRAGAPVGECKVSVSEPPKRAALDDSQTRKLSAEDVYKMQHGGRLQPADAASQSDPGSQKPQLPLKYSNPEKSGLTATVSTDAKKNVFEFKLAAQ